MLLLPATEEWARGFELNWAGQEATQGSAQPRCPAQVPNGDAPAKAAGQLPRPAAAGWAVRWRTPPGQPPSRGTNPPRALVRYGISFPATLVATTAGGGPPGGPGGEAGRAAPGPPWTTARACARGTPISRQKELDRAHTGSHEPLGEAMISNEPRCFPAVPDSRRKLLASALVDGGVKRARRGDRSRGDESLSAPSPGVARTVEGCARRGSFLPGSGQSHIQGSWKNCRRLSAFPCLPDQHGASK